MNQHTKDSCDYDALVEQRVWQATWDRLSRDGKVYLEVPWKDKDDAKALGAWWDSSNKKWYARNPSVLMECWQWAPKKEE
jgi:hypothetical protein